MVLSPGRRPKVCPCGAMHSSGLQVTSSMSLQFVFCQGTQIPNWVDNYSGAELAAVVEKRIDDALTRFNGSLTGWDVNNEMTHGEKFLTATSDPDIRSFSIQFLFILFAKILLRVKMYQWAHQKDPSLQLFVNDYSIISNPGAQVLAHLSKL